MQEVLTVGQVLDLLTKMVDQGIIDKESKLEIRTQDPSIAAAAAVGITNVFSGFDWDHGRVFLSPAVPLVTHPAFQKMAQKGKE